MGLQPVIVGRIGAVAAKRAPSVFALTTAFVLVTLMLAWKVAQVYGGVGLTHHQAALTALLTGGNVLLLAWTLSAWVTNSVDPFALTRHPTPNTTGDPTPLPNDPGLGVNSAGTGIQPIRSNFAYSLSKLQTLLYFAVVVFVFVTVYALRLFEAGLAAPLPSIPIEVIALIGLSAATTLGGQALAVRYLEEQRTSATDRSDLIRNRDGYPDLSKLQMLVWTIVAVLVYLSSTVSLVRDGCYLLDGPPATTAPVQRHASCRAVWGEALQANGQVAPNSRPSLPNFDELLLVLAGVVQGSYFAGRLLGTRPAPRIDGAYLDASPPGGTALRLVGFFAGVRQTVVPSGLILYDCLVEISNDAGVRRLADLNSAATFVTPAPTTLTGQVTAASVTGTMLTLTNLIPAGNPAQRYTVRVAIGGTWSEPAQFTLG